MSGKPYKYTPIKQQATLGLLAAGWTRAEIAKVLDVDVTTIFRTIKNHPDLATQAQTIASTHDAHVETALLKNALTGNLGAQIFWLTNRQKERWRNVWKYEHSGDNGKPIEMDIRVLIDKIEHLRLEAPKDA